MQQMAIKAEDEAGFFGAHPHWTVARRTQG